jgi:hypothetical protein
VRRTERPRSLRPAILAGAATCVLFAAVAHAASTREMVILLRALAYDRNFDDRVRGAVDVAVLYRDALPQSKQCMTDELAMQAELAQVKLKGRDIVLTSVELGASTVDAAKDAEFWFICPGLDGDLLSITAEAETRHRITAAQSRSYVQKGIVLGIEEGDSESTLYVNLPASKKVGAEFNSQLLGVATVIR